MKKFTTVLLTDAYKVSHLKQTPQETKFSYTNTTPRGSRIPDVDQVVVFGIQYLIKEYLLNQFNETFFKRPKQEVLQELQDFFLEYYGSSVDTSPFADLHDLQYLPLKIKALPEGSLCNLRVPFMTIINTDERFHWLTNYIETLIQCTIWNPITCATIARRFRKLMDAYAQETGQPDFVAFQGHNFSMRGMSSLESAILADAGHLLSFVGSDTLPGNLFVKEYYGADPKREMISCSVPATEHAVTCVSAAYYAKLDFEQKQKLGGNVEIFDPKNGEKQFLKDLITKKYPTGIISVVADTWDLFYLITVLMTELKQEILQRDGKLVCRPDSGNPVKILCGYTVNKINKTADEFIEYSSRTSSKIKYFDEPNCDAVLTSDGLYFNKQGKQLSKNEIIGVVQLLYENFGGSYNSKGFIELDPHVGVIYGDAINYERAQQIFKQLKDKQFASTNVVLGIGSFTYQYNTRDTFGIACKATWAKVGEHELEIYKDPVTDDGTKKSARGLLKVKNGKLYQQVSPQEESEGDLKVVFENGILYNEQNFHKIRERLRNVNG